MHTPIVEFMKVITVVGSIGYGGINKLRETQRLLKNAGFNVFDHISEKGMDYSNIDQFLDKKELAMKITKHDLEHVMKADILVVANTGPSYGTAIEMYEAKLKGKIVIFLSEDKVPTPWPIAFSDYVVTSNKELIELLKHLVNEPSITKDKRKPKAIVRDRGPRIEKV